MSDGAPSVQSKFLGSWRFVALFVIALFVFDVVQQLIVGRTPFTDEIWYKSAGLELARHGRFAAPELAGFPFDPPMNEIFGANPPIYGFTFAVWTKLLGFGEWQAIVFDSVLRFVLIGVSLALTQQLVKPKKSSGLIVLALVLYTLGFYGRPDDLSMIFAVLSALALGFTRRVWFASIVGGAMFALCMGTSVGAAISWSLPLLVILWYRWNALGRSWRFVLGCVIGIALAFAPVVVFYLSHPGAIDQFRQHGSMYVGQSIIERWKRAFEVAPTAILPFIVALIVLLLVLIRSMGDRISDQRTWLALACVGGYVVTIFLAPGKFPYLWFLAPILGASLLYEIASRKTAWNPALITALLLGVGSSVYEQSNRWRSRAFAPSGVSYRSCAKTALDLIPQSSTVVTDTFWSQLAIDRKCYDAFSGGDRMLDQTDYVMIHSKVAFDAWSPKAQQALFDPTRFQKIYEPARESPFTFHVFKRVKGE